MFHYGSVEVARFGRVWIGAQDKLLIAVLLGGKEKEFLDILGNSTWEHSPNSKEVVEIGTQLHEYFQGRRQRFDVQIRWQQMTDFQKIALQRTIMIPFGEVMTYGDLAIAIGKSPDAARAVGRAMATNPIPIIIPCHRVVGSRGELTGYGGPGGIATKAWLLELEGHRLPEQIRLPW